MQDQGHEAPTAEAGHAPRPGSAIWVERALCLLILASLAGTLNLIIAMHRRARLDHAAEQPAQLVKTPEPTKAPRPPEIPVAPIAPKIAKKKVSPPVPQVPQPSDDPTKKAVNDLSVATAREIDAARQADRKAQMHERARQVAIADSERWRRRELLVKQQVASLSERTRKIDQDIDKLAAQRDVLARERDALKAAVSKAKQGDGSYAVLPYKGPNGSWRRPIVLECGNGSVTLRPKGPTFSMLDLSAMINPRSSPVIVAIARELLRVQASDSPDGAPVVPYFVFLVRPDGIRPYYELRARLEPLGIAFGYELIEQDLKVDVPDFDDLSTWDGTIPLEVPEADPAQGGGGPGGDDQDGLSWPGGMSGSRADRTAARGAAGGGTGRQAATGTGDEDTDSPDAFVWPSRPRATAVPGMTEERQEHPDRSSNGGGRGNGGGHAIGLLPAPRGGGTARGGTRGGLNFALESAPTGRGGTGRGESPRNGMGQGSLASPEGRGDRNAAGSPADGGSPGELNDPAGSGSGRPSPSPTGRVESRSPEGPGPAPGARALPGLPDLEPAGTGPISSPMDQTPGQAPRTASETRAADLAAPGVLAPGMPPGSADGPGVPSGGRTSPGDPRKIPSGNPGLRAGVQVDPSLTANGTQPPAGTLGLGLGSLTAAGEASKSAGGSGLVLGSDSAASASKEGHPDEGVKGPRIGSRIPDGPAKKVDVPFEIVVVCQPEGLMIHPGGYRITRSSLERNKKDDVLIRELVAVARQRAAADPNIRPQPRVKFLVESGGGTNFWNARKQILFSGLGWPMSLQVTGAQGASLLGQEAWQ